MGVTQILFWFLSVVAIFSALMVVTAKNPVYSVLWLIATFFAISGHYILLNAQFLAIVNPTGALRTQMTGGARIEGLDLAALAELVRRLG